MGGGMRSWGWLILKFSSERSVWAPMGDGVSQSSRGGHDGAGTPSGAGTVQQQEPGP